MKAKQQPQRVILSQTCLRRDSSSFKMWTEATAFQKAGVRLNGKVNAFSPLILTDQYIIL